jgi:hypothetical protein
MLPKITLIWDCQRNQPIQFDGSEDRRLFYVGLVGGRPLLYESWRQPASGEFIVCHYHVANIIKGEPTESLIPAGTILEIVQTRSAQEVRDAGGTGTAAAFQEAE